MRERKERKKETDWCWGRWGAWETVWSLCVFVGLFFFVCVCVYVCFLPPPFFSVVVYNSISAFSPFFFLSFCLSKLQALAWKSPGG